MERWDHASLLAAGSSPCRSPAKRLCTSPAGEDTQSWCSTRHLSEPDSPLDGFDVDLYDSCSFLKLSESATIRHSGWLLKAYGDGPQRQWRRRFVYITADRLCYTPDPDVEGVRYIPMDRIPVRALPRGYGPKLGVTMVEDRQVDRSNPQFSPKKAGCVFSVACGSHTHFFAAPSQAEAKAWVEAITDSWVKCVKHTARGTHQPSLEEVLALKEARWKAENQALRRSLVEAGQQRVRESTAQWQAAAALAAPVQPSDQVVCYDIEVVTGRQAGAGTTSRVYLELCGEDGSSGEHRLMYREGSGRTPFAAGATDCFRLHCRPLGQLLKVRVYHNNTGPHPSWFLEEVRVRRQGSAAWTLFPCNRWLAVHQDDGRVMRELFSTTEQATEAPPAPQQQLKLPPPPAQQPVAAERVVQPVWYQVVVCTASQEGAGLAPSAGAEVSLVLHGSTGSSQRIKLPAEQGDFQQGQEDVFRVQLSSVGALEKLTVGLSGSSSEQASWLLEQVEVTDEAAGQTTYFPCSVWLGSGKGRAETSLLGSRTNPREAQRQAAHLQQQLGTATKQLAEVQAELEAARSSASKAEQASREREAELQARLAALQAEVAQLQKQLEEAQGRAAAAEACSEQLQAELRRVEEAAAGLRRQQDADRHTTAATSARVAELEAQLDALHEQVALAQEKAAAAGARARQLEVEARRSEEAADQLRRQYEAYRQEHSDRSQGAEGDMRRLRAEVAAKAAEVEEALQGEREAVEECERLSRELAAERLRAKEMLSKAEAAAAAARAVKEDTLPASAQLLDNYRVCIHTSAEPSNAGTCRPVCLELLGTHGSSGILRLERQGGGSTCFAAGCTDVFLLEAPAVGELQQLHIRVDMEGADGVPPGDASWHLDTVEVSCKSKGEAAGTGAGAGCTSYFVCRRWLDARNDYSAELAATARNPRQEEVEYKVVVHTSSLAGCGTGGNVFVDLRGEKGGSSGVLTLRNKGGSFRPGQVDEFAFSLPSLGALSELRVGHDGGRDWHLDKVEVKEGSTCTTYFFPCQQWVKSSGAGGGMARSLHLRAYTTDPASLPVQYRVELEVKEASGQLGPGSLRLTLFGSRGESMEQHLDASRAAPGRQLTCMFEAANVGHMERLRIGLAPAKGPKQKSALLLSRVVVTNMPSGERATFYCPECLRSTDPYDYEVDAAEGEQEEVACSYRVEVQTSDVRRAGTTGSVFLTIIGDQCSIGPYQLSNLDGLHFQKGQLDVFEIEGAPDCGQMRQIEVRHDGQGRSNGWHLAWVKLANTTTGAVAMFKCNRWVDKRSLHDPGAVAMLQPLPPDQAAAAAGRLNARDRLLVGSRGKGATLAAAALHSPVTQDVQMQGEADVGSSTAMLVEAGGLPGYRVVFHTSRVCGSGTRAKVHFELTGSQGSSGVLHPVGTPKSFGAGRCDIFDYPALPWLGEVQAARVGTDGSGLFPAWHLQMMVVTHLPTGRVWQFSCHQWIDKKVNYTCWLQLDTTQASPAGSHWWHVGQKPAALITAASYGGSFTGAGQLQLASPGSMGSPVAAQQRPDSPARSQVLQSKHLRQVGGGSGSPHSPVRQVHNAAQQQQQQHMFGSPSQHIMRSGSGMPGSPLIRAAGLPGGNRWY